jgi:hypothetical protein
VPVRYVPAVTDATASRSTARSVGETVSTPAGASAAVPSEPSGRAAGSLLERQIDLGRGAIRMVADCHYPAVTVASLRYGLEALEVLRPEATRAGVILVPLETAGGGLDLRAERADRHHGLSR